MAKTGETYRSHICMQTDIIKTSIKMWKGEWLEFKKNTHSVSLTTCLVVRALVRKWNEAFRAQNGCTKMKNASRLGGISRNKHEDFAAAKVGIRWVYCKMTQTLYDPRKLKSWKWNPANPARSRNIGLALRGGEHRREASISKC